MHLSAIEDHILNSQSVSRPVVTGRLTSLIRMQPKYWRSRASG